MINIGEIINEIACVLMVAVLFFTTFAIGRALDAWLEKG